jgi:hypothetical protein
MEKTMPGVTSCTSSEITQAQLIHQVQKPTRLDLLSRSSLGMCSAVASSPKKTSPMYDELIAFFQAIGTYLARIKSALVSCLKLDCIFGKKRDDEARRNVETLKPANIEEDLSQKVKKKRTLPEHLRFVGGIPEIAFERDIELLAISLEERFDDVKELDWNDYKHCVAFLEHIYRPELRYRAFKTITERIMRVKKEEFESAIKSFNTSKNVSWSPQDSVDKSGLDNAVIYFLRGLELCIRLSKETLSEESFAKVNGSTIWLNADIKRELFPEAGDMYWSRNLKAEDAICYTVEKALQDVRDTLLSTLTKDVKDKNLPDSFKGTTLAYIAKLLDEKLSALSYDKTTKIVERPLDRLLMQPSNLREIPALVLLQQKKSPGLR